MFWTKCVTYVLTAPLFRPSTIINRYSPIINLICLSGTATFKLEEISSFPGIQFANQFYGN